MATHARPVRRPHRRAAQDGATISSGAAMDIQMATQFARHMILEWGMSERLGFVHYAGVDTP